MSWQAIRWVRQPRSLTKTQFRVLFTHANHANPLGHAKSRGLGAEIAARLVQRAGLLGHQVGFGKHCPFNHADPRHFGEG
jgi:hypothetical protein